MRKVYLDTSVVLRLLTGEPVRQAELALSRLDLLRRRKGVAVISDLVLSEVYFALQYHFKVPKTEAVKALASIVSSDFIECSDVARSVLGLPGIARMNPGLVDRLIIGQAQAAGAPLLTFEKAAGKLTGVEVLR
jgi:predicted nucleic acid-binding protein